MIFHSINFGVCLKHFTREISKKSIKKILKTSSFLHESGTLISKTPSLFQSDTTIPRETKPRLNASSPQVSNNTEAPPTAQSPSPIKSNFKVGTYSDPYLLSEQFENMIKHEKSDFERVYALLKRNRDILNPQIATTLMKRLCDVGQLENVFIVYTFVKYLRVIQITAMMRTIVFNTFAKQARKSKGAEERSKIMENAIGLWDKLPDPINVIHLNAILKVCHACAAEGGWEKAMYLYRASVRYPNAYYEQDNPVPKPDIITFTTMINFCADNRSADGYQAMKQVWEDAIKWQQKRTSRGQKAEFDEQLLAQILLGCIRQDKIDDLGLDIVCNWLGLPIEMDKPLEMNHSNSISSHLIDILMRFGLKMKRPELSMRWFDLLSVKPGFKLDNLLAKTVVKVCLELKDHQRANAIVHEPCLDIPTVCALKTVIYHQQLLDRNMDGLGVKVRKLLEEILSHKVTLLPEHAYYLFYCLIKLKVPIVDWKPLADKFYQKSIETSRKGRGETFQENVHYAKEKATEDNSSSFKAQKNLKFTEKCSILLKKYIQEE